MAELGQQLRKRLIDRARQAIQEKASNPELQAIKAVNLLEDLEVVFNLLAEQALEWHSLHFPEMRQEVGDNRLYLRLVGIGERKNFSPSEVQKIVQDEGLCKRLCERAKSSMGAQFKEQDLSQVIALASLALQASASMQSLSNYIDSSMRAIAPNFSEAAGPTLAAKLLAKAGSLKRLAMMPSSTIQVLGAEKALFRHLKSGAKPPKHGLILQHPLLRKAKKEERGKAAKSLSAKLSIAARKDYFSKSIK